MPSIRLLDSRAHAVDQLLVSETATAVKPGGEHGDDFEHIAG